MQLLNTIMLAQKTLNPNQSIRKEGKKYFSVIPLLPAQYTVSDMITGGIFMDYELELELEREYTARVQQLLYAVIQLSRGNAAFQDDTIRLMLTDAWEELRMKPTALSQQDLDQLDAEINRFIARRTFAETRAKQSIQKSITKFI